MRYVSTFSGVEAATLAWEPLGWEPLAFSENDPFCCAVLATRYPDVENLGDIREVKWHGFRGAADLVVGGSPCQSFSSAGSRTGLEGESGLMWEWVRCVREVMPRWCVWENVPGALSSGGGEDFRCLLQSLDGLGYGLAWRVLDAQHFGVPQRRRRVFLVGSLGDRRAADVLFEPESLRWDSETCGKKRAKASRGTGRGAEEAGAVIAFKWNQGAKARSLGMQVEEAPTLTAETPPAVWCIADDTGKSAVDRDMVGTLTAHNAKAAPSVTGNGKVRRLTPRECERLQGMPDDWTKVSYRGRLAEECADGPRYRAIGNSMAVPVMRWIGERLQMVEDGQCEWSEA